MKTKLINVSVILALILVTVLSVTNEAKAATLDVCPSGCSYSSIQTAILNAAPDDTITVAAGTYTEKITIFKPLTLQGTDAVIDGSGSGPVVSIVANDVSFSGFTVKNAGTDPASAAAIALVNVTGCTVSNVATENNLFGFALLNADSNTFTGNTLNGSGLYGIYVGYNANGASTDNSIANNTISSSGKDGIYVDINSSNNTITANQIINTVGVGGEGNGIYLYRAPSNTITANTISGNAKYGIETKGSGNSTISNNTLTNNLYGIYLRHDSVVSSTPTTILHNKLFGNTEFDLRTTTEFSSIPAEMNWWGSAAGPAAGKVSSNVDYLPWCLTEACLAATAPVHNATQNTWFNEIQPAIDAASSGDVIEVGPGTYLQPNPGTEKAGIKINKALTLKSTHGAAATIIEVADGNLTRGIQVIGPNLGLVTIDGFTVKGFTQTGIIHYYDTKVGTAVHVLNNIVIPRGNYLKNGIQVSGDNSIVRGNTIIGAYLTEDWGSAGILVDEANNVLIENNTIGGGDNGMDYGIAVSNYTNDNYGNLTILNNTITNADIGFGITNYYSGTVSDILFQYNKVTGHDWAAYAYMGTGATNTNIDLTINWWGTPTGPLPGTVDITGAAYKPWCLNEACTVLSSEAGVAVLNPGATPADFTAAAAAANQIVFTAGTYNAAAPFVVDQPGLTILLQDGVVIQNTGSCFTIDANYTTIKTESIGGAKCIPTNGAHGILANGSRLNIVIEGLEIDGTGQTTGDGIHFAGGITDLVIVNNKVHDLTGHGLYFAVTPTNVVDIQGNLFALNGGVGVSSPEDINVAFNSWGAYGGPTAGDGISGITSFVPWTHVDLYMLSSGTPTLNTVMAGNEITYTIYGNLQQIKGVDFTLTIPAGVEYVSSAAKDVYEHETLTAGAGTLRFVGYNLAAAPKTGEAIALFEVKLKGVTLGTYELKLGSDLFSMAPSFGSSNFVYAYELKSGTLNVLDELKIIDIDLLQSADLSNWVAVPGSLTAGFDIPLNPANAYEYLDVDSLTSNRPLADGLYPFYIDETNVPANFFAYWAAKGVVAGASGWQGIMWEIINGDEPMFYLKVSDTGTTFDLIDGLQYLQSGGTVLNPLRISGDYPLGAYSYSGVLKDAFGLEAAVEVGIRFIGPYTVTGTVSMQSRSTRAGVPATLNGGTFGPYDTQSFEAMSNNLVFTNVAADTYIFTTLQPRYLNIPASMNKVVLVVANRTLPALQLKGGNANWTDNKVDVSDAGVVGAKFGIGNINDDADVNFDDVVDILDLSLVGVNYMLTSETAYGAWTP